MTDLQKLEQDFKTATDNFDREDSAVLELERKLSLLPLNASADEYSRLHAELALQKRRLVESVRVMQAAGARLDQAQAAEAEIRKRESDMAQFEAKQIELNKASCALADAKVQFQRLASAIPQAEAKLYVLMGEFAILQTRLSPTPKQTQPKWYDSEWDAITAKRGGDLILIH